MTIKFYISHTKLMVSKGKSILDGLSKVVSLYNRDLSFQLSFNKFGKPFIYFTFINKRINESLWFNNYGYT